MSAALSARLGIENQLASEGDFAETEVPTLMTSASWKATSIYMAFVKRGVPNWFE